MTNRTVSDQDAFIHPRHFVERLGELVATRAGDTALVVVAEQNGESVETVLCYREFGQRVRALAALLQREFEKGDRVLILLDNDEHYAISMFACFHAGVIAVPVFPPESARRQHLVRLAGIAADAQARGILMANALHALVDVAASEFGVSTVIAVDEVDPFSAVDWQPHEPATSDVAFLQYTSGSTSAPKGVMVTHGNLMANERAIRAGLGIGSHDKFGVWSPLFHDMGLIGGLLQPFYSGIPCVLASPRYFLERPVRWLQMIARHRITISGGPDFAYRLCLDRIKDNRLAGLDLSSWRVAYTGAEPVRHDTMAAFIERYRAVGFDPGAVYPCYGLAEATLFVTGGRRGEGMATGRFDAQALAERHVAADDAGRVLVGCGAVPQAHELLIVDPGTGEAAAGDAIGEIWASGPSIAAGYWNKPVETAETFPERQGRRWLRTGDLGFVRDGQLFVAGRAKDMIIVRGHNVYPQDIERAVEAQVEAVRKGRVAAFSVNTGDGPEGIGVAAEVSHGLQKLVPARALVDALSLAVSEQCGQAPRVVVLLNPGGLPKTSSGKLQRAACRQAWQARSLDAYASSLDGMLDGAAPGSGDEDPRSAEGLDVLASLVRDVLGHDALRRYAADDHFFALGGGSLTAVQLAARISEHWAIDCPVRTVFERPRLGELAKAVQALRASGPAAPLPTMLVLDERRRAEPQPLSPAQQRQWFLWQLDPLGSAHHVGLRLRLAGALDEAALAGAVQHVTARHESLRTVFRVAAEGGATQAVVPSQPMHVPVIDLRGLPTAGREPEADLRLQALLREPFDLTRGPLWRVVVVRLADELRWLCVVMHHIVSDGVSMQRLLEEMAAHVGAGRHGGAPEPLAPPTQYLDYAAWHRAWLADGDGNGEGQCEGDRQLAWWRGQLGIEHPVLSLPTDRPRQAQAHYTAAQHAWRLPDDLQAALPQVAARHDATPFTVLLAAFQVLLFRYTGLADLRVGVPVANRPRSEAQGVIGLLVNTLVLRNVLHGRATLGQVLDQASAAALEAQAHQDLPFDRLVEALRPERSLSHNPLVQVTVNHLKEDVAALERGLGVTVLAQDLPRDTVQFDLTLEIREAANGGLALSFVYAAELFDVATIEAMARHFGAVLEAIARRPQQAVADVVLMDPAELSALSTSMPIARPTAPLPIHQQVERHAARRPDAVALVKGDVELSYRELNRRANRLAHALIRRGIGPESRVGIAVERSVDMVVSLLATLKAGGAYVPLDPAYPADRLAFMMRDSGMVLLLSQQHVLARLPSAEDGLLVLDVDDPAAWDRGDEHDPGVPLHDDHLAYVIYTSGSTGLPKGVGVAHGPLARHLAAISEIYGVDASHRELLFFSLSFDAAVEQWMTPLHGGGAVVLCDREQLDGESFARLVHRHGITTLHVPPAYLRVLAPQIAALPSRVRTCIVGGEAFPWADHALARQAFRSPRIVNAYGPTETIITPTAWVGDTDERAPTGYVPIGRPVGSRRVYVLDDDLALVPRGAVGELYVGGPEIARGYVGRPGLTAERFVADPFGGEGGRLYRTGDRVRWLHDGGLEYFGRRDGQVKVRGFRVELGEIEAQLLAQPGVREGVVVIRSDGGHERIVAYACAAPGAELQVEVLRAALREGLPDYMVPNALVLLPALPLTPNGKVDRGALPEPHRGGGEHHAAPAGDTEARLAAVWSEVLGLPHIGRHDNFFDLGGHSLLLMKLRSRIGERLGAEVSMVDLFQHATVATLAARLSGGAADTAQAARQTQARAARQRGHFLPRSKPTERQPS